MQPLGLKQKLARFAHHPTCSRHSSHLIYLFSVPLCLGCFSMLCGSLLGFAATRFSPLLELELAHWLSLHTCLVIPTLFQPSIQNKTYKIFARSLLGAASCTWCIGAFAIHYPYIQQPLWALSSMAWLALCTALLLAVRRRYTPNPCTDCKEAIYSTCDWKHRKTLPVIKPF
jgi:hypothetical protein